MKKYFLFFTTSFMAFELFFIASSSPSNGMINESPDEPNKSIIIYSSQRTNAREIALQGEDPAADLRLHPGKGETLWLKERQLPCLHPYLDGKVYSFLYPEFIEVTLSYPAWHGDLLSIAYELSAYNVEKVGMPDTEKIMKASYKNSEGIPVVSFEGSLAQHSLTFCFKPEEAFDSPKEFLSLLRSLQNNARAQGVHMMRTCFFPAQNIPFLPQEGFHSMGEIISFHKGKRVTAYYKILHSDPEISENDSHVRIEWDEEEDDFSPPNFGCSFGLFVRDDKGTIKGGISGYLCTKVTFPFSGIETFYMDRALRGTGIGKEIFLRAEEFAKENGAHYMQLDTMDYQAPWFYKKMGYTQVITEYESEKTLDGKWVNGYLFRKLL